MLIDALFFYAKHPRHYCNTSTNLLTIRVIRVITVSMKDRDLLKLLLKDGWELVSVKGSHHKIKKGEKTEILPVHGTDIKKGLLSAILKRTGLEVKR